MAAEEGRVAIWEVDVATRSKRLFASGLRNPNTMLTVMRQPSSPSAVCGCCSVVRASKKSKKCGIIEKKVGEVISKPMSSLPSTLGEPEVSRLVATSRSSGL